MENSQHQQLWNMFECRDDPAAMKVGWEESGQNGVEIAGFADTHSTGNKQRDESDHMVVAERREVLSPAPKSEVILTDCLIHDVMTQECESADFSNGHVGTLGRVAVPDTVCRRTLVGAYTLQLIESHLADQGLKTHRRREISEFRFGNSETLIGRECVILPACVGRHKFLIKTSIPCGKGRNTSLVLSKEFLGELGSVLDMGDDTVSFRHFGVSMKSGVTERGHYAMSFFEFQNQECLIGEVQHMKHDRQYDIQALERQVKDSDGAKGTRDVLSYHSVQRMIPSQHIQEMFQNVVNCPGTAETTISNKQLFPTKQWTGCQPRSQVQWFQRRANTTNWDAISPFNRCKGRTRAMWGGCKITSSVKVP